MPLSHEMTNDWRVPTNRKFSNTKPSRKSDDFLHRRCKRRSVRCNQEWRQHNLLKGEAGTSSVLNLMLLLGFFIHPHRLLSSAVHQFRMDKLKSISSWWFCHPASHHLSAHWPWSFTQHRFLSLQVFHKGLFMSQSRLLCQKTFNSGLLECHSSVSLRLYHSSHLFKGNCFERHCA